MSANREDSRSPVPFDGSRRRFPPESSLTMALVERSGRSSSRSPAADAVPRPALRTSSPRSWPFCRLHACLQDPLEFRTPAPTSPDPAPAPLFVSTRIGRFKSSCFLDCAVSASMSDLLSICLFQSQHSSARPSTIGLRVPEMTSSLEPLW